MKIIYWEKELKYLMMKFLAVNEFYDYYMITLTIIKMKKKLKLKIFCYLYIINQLDYIYKQMFKKQ